MAEQFTPLESEPLPPFTPLETTLLNCLQRLEELERCTGILVQAAQADVQHHQEQQQLLLTLGQQLATTQQLTAALSDRPMPPPVSPAIDWQPLMQQVHPLQTALQTQNQLGKVLIGVAIVGFTGLALYAGLVIQPAATGAQATLGRQQPVLHQLLICTLHPQAQRCTELRRAIAPPDRAP